MKFVVVLLVTLAVAVNAGGLEDYIKARDDCFKDLNMSASEIDLTKQDRFLSMAYKDQPQNLKCYSQCLYKKLKALKPDDSWDYALVEKFLMAAAQIDSTKAKAIMDKCKNVTGADNCEKAFNYEVCMHQGHT